ncbi:hypothetical protein K1S16_16385, partial [Klebsiella pneumoniae]|nr:hypothetical protein [Klebsiella pneumoniae]
SSGAGRTSDGNGSHASTLKSPSYTKSVSWQHYQRALEDYSNGQLDQSKAQEYNASRYLLISEVNKLFLSSGMPVIVPLYGF